MILEVSASVSWGILDPWGLPFADSTWKLNLGLNFVQWRVDLDQVECLLDGGVAVGVGRRSRTAQV